MADPKKKAPTQAARIVQLENQVSGLELEVKLLNDANVVQTKQLKEIVATLGLLNNRSNAIQINVGKLIGIGSLTSNAMAELALSLQPKVPVFEVVIETAKPDNDAFNAVSMIDLDGTKDIAIVSNEATEMLTEQHRDELRTKMFALELPHGSVAYFAMRQIGERQMTLAESQASIHPEH